jgi:hypothetical protein
MLENGNPSILTHALKCEVSVFDMKIKNIKSQHEIAGFATIIVIVCIMGIIFLALSIRPNDKSRTSAEVSNFLQASMHYTTACAVGYIPNYKDLQDLVKSCYRNEICLDQRRACDALSDAYSDIISKSFIISEQSSYKAYELNIYYKDLNENAPNEFILNITGGIHANCSAKMGASQPIFIDNGNINVELEFCYG